MGQPSCARILATFLECRPSECVRGRKYTHSKESYLTQTILKKMFYTSVFFFFFFMVPLNDCIAKEEMKVKVNGIVKLKEYLQHKS